MGPGGGGALPLAQVLEEVGIRVVEMLNEKKRPARKLEKRIEPFASEQERLDALENLRNWIEKLEHWQDEIRLKIKVSKRDLN